MASSCSSAEAPRLPRQFARREGVHAQGFGDGGTPASSPPCGDMVAGHQQQAKLTRDQREEPKAGIFGIVMQRLLDQLQSSRAIAGRQRVHHFEDIGLGHVGRQRGYILFVDRPLAINIGETSLHSSLSARSKSSLTTEAMASAAACDVISAAYSCPGAFAEYPARQILRLAEGADEAVIQLTAAALSRRLLSLSRPSSDQHQTSVIRQLGQLGDQAIAGESCLLGRRRGA